MPTTISSRAFRRNVSAAKMAAESKPVLITDRGGPTHGLISIELYRRLTGEHGTIVDGLASASSAAGSSARVSETGGPDRTASRSATNPSAQGRHRDRTTERVQGCGTCAVVAAVPSRAAACRCPQEVRVFIAGPDA